MKHNIIYKGYFYIIKTQCVVCCGNASRRTRVRRSPEAPRVKYCVTNFKLLNHLLFASLLVLVTDSYIHYSLIQS